MKIGEFLNQLRGDGVQITGDDIITMQAEYIGLLGNRVSESLLEILAINLYSGDLRVKLWALKHLWRYGRMKAKHQRARIGSAVDDNGN